MTDRPTRIDRALDELPGLDNTTRVAVKLAALAWLDARHARVLDSHQHWDRFATRLESSAYAPDMQGLLRQLCRRFELPRAGVETTRFALSLPHQLARDVLRTMRQHAGQITDLVRFLRESGVLKDSQKAREELAQQQLATG